MWGGMGKLSDRVRNSSALVSSLVEHSCLRACWPGGPAEGGGSDCPETRPEARQNTSHRGFVLKNGLYITFVVPLPYIDALLFQLARDENDCLLPGAARDSDSCRCAEKRDWAWVDAQVLVDSLSKGRCRAIDQEGQPLHLLPRLAVTLRAYLPFMIAHLGCHVPCGELCLSGQVLDVSLEKVGRCLHLFGIGKHVSPECIREVMDHASADAEDRDGAKVVRGRAANDKNAAEAAARGGAGAEACLVVGRKNEIACSGAVGSEGSSCCQDHAVSVFSGGRVQRVTIYKDRLGSSNCFVLFDQNASAVMARARIKAMEDGECAA